MSLRESASNSRILLEADAVALDLDGVRLLPSTSVRLSTGECVAVLGENGAGKTTLLRLLAGRVRPSLGTVTLYGLPVDERRREARREIATLIEAPALYPDLTLIDHLELIEATWSRASSQLVPGLGTAALDSFGLTALQNRFPHELSSGQRQLAALAVTFARPANVLLLDEPEQRLDPDRRARVAEVIQAACAKGVAVMIASHDAELVACVADRSLRVGA